MKGLTGWMKDLLGERVAGVDAGRRSSDHPVVALLPEDAPTAQLRAMMEAMGQEAPPVVAKIEVNPQHDLIKKLAKIREEKSELAGKVVEQLTDGALLAAGLPSNPQQFNRKLSGLLSEVLDELK